MFMVLNYFNWVLKIVFQYLNILQKMQLLPGYYYKASIRISNLVYKLMKEAFDDIHTQFLPTFLKLGIVYYSTKCHPYVTTARYRFIYIYILSETKKDIVMG